MHDIPHDYWRAIVKCDPSYDDTFVYAVKTTRIFCRPSCKSRVPKRDNVAIYKNAYIAIEKGFRPCKRCKPDGHGMPANEWVEQIAAWIDEHYQSDITLERLAELFHGSPYHLQRSFKQVKGSSPAEYVQSVRLRKAISLLSEGDMLISEIGAAAGFSSPPYFITLFKKRYGCTPAAYRKRRRNNDA